MHKHPKAIHGWKDREEESLSDHRYLTFWIEAPTQEVTFIGNRRSTDWKLFHDSLLDPPYRPNSVTTIAELDNAAADLTTRLMDALRQPAP